MKNLKAYVAEKNTWGAIFGSRALDLNNDMDRIQIAQGIDCDLSPENLHCDGEISQAQAMRKLRKLNKVAAELLMLDPSVENHLGEYYP
jgi:uncharacterized protein YqfA (UPF0365 family)|tara:strand:+ start:164 stop:430 length:267 start_codon:yes stop_codon:yes gene_type:complete